MILIIFMRSKFARCVAYTLQSMIIIVFQTFVNLARYRVQNETMTLNICLRFKFVMSIAFTIQFMSTIVFQAYVNEMRFMIHVWLRKLSTCMRFKLLFLFVLQIRSFRIDVSILRVLHFYHANNDFKHNRELEIQYVIYCFEKYSKFMYHNVLISS